MLWELPRQPGDGFHPATPLRDGKPPRSPASEGEDQAAIPGLSGKAIFARRKRQSEADQIEGKDQPPALVKLSRQPSARHFQGSMSPKTPNFQIRGPDFEWYPFGFPRKAMENVQTPRVLVEKLNIRHALVSNSP